MQDVLGHADTVESWRHEFDVSVTRLDPNLTSYSHAWPPGYAGLVPVERAVSDARVLERLEPGGPATITTSPEPARGTRAARISVFVADRELALGEILPALQSLGLEVLGERPFDILRPDNTHCHIYDFAVLLPTGLGEWSDEDQARVVRAFEDMLASRVDPDPFNALVVVSRLTADDVHVLRSYGEYLVQGGLPLGGAYIATVLIEHPHVAERLLELFHSRFDPAATGDRPRVQVESDIVDAVLEDIDNVESLGADRVLRALLAAIQATVRTNHYTRNEPRAVDDPEWALALKLQPASIPELVHPRPQFEVFVHSPEVLGVHIRFGAVARGGLRWSDRPEDLRTEILGLARAQVSKNAVIVPVGAKGGFVVRRPPTGDTPDEARKALHDKGVACYRIFIRALLDVHDNLSRDDRSIISRRLVVGHDGPDPYIVVAPDKGTASFSDIANTVSTNSGFWLGDAFASGGRTGYDHKAMGITARGAWASVRRHFRELALDIDSDPITAIGIGDMSGDVFGNGMLLSPRLRLVAAFDHRHIFIDPTPDAAVAFAERERLFSLPRTSWKDYNPTLISAGGGVFARAAKTVPLTDQMRQVLDLDPDVTALSPTALIRAILKAPVDLLWNGGIGTYVKASWQTHTDVGDRTNDAVRVDGRELRVRVIGEGGNLGLTQPGRIEYARAGGRLNTDALDNSAGVNCSDLEVNIKIGLQTEIDAGRLTEDARTDFLAEMTDEVSNLVLTENVRQNELLGVTRALGHSRLDVHDRLMTALEASDGLDRHLLDLPTPAVIADLEQAGEALSYPELAVLTAQVKLSVKAALLADDLPDDPSLDYLIRGYFPEALWRRHPEAVRDHPLRREIIATALANEMIDLAGLTFVHRLAEDLNVPVGRAARAYLVASRVFDIRTLRKRIRKAEISSAVGYRLMIEANRVLDRAARWFLTFRPQPICLDDEIDRYAAVVTQLGSLVPTWLRGRDERALQERMAADVSAGAPADLALEVYGLLDRFCLLDVTTIAAVTATPPERVAAIYFAMKDRLEISAVLDDVTTLEHSSRWDMLSRLGLRDDLYLALRDVCLQVLHEATDVDCGTDDLLDGWESCHHERLEAVRTTLHTSGIQTRPTMASLSVVVRQLRTLTARVSEPVGAMC